MHFFNAPLKSNYFFNINSHKGLNVLPSNGALWKPDHLKTNAATLQTTSDNKAQYVEHIYAELLLDEFRTFEIQNKFVHYEFLMLWIFFFIISVWQNWSF